MKAKAQFYRDGYLAIPNVFSNEAIFRSLSTIKRERAHRKQNGESEDDLRQAKDRLHDMASMEKDPFMDELAKEINQVVQGLFHAEWIEDNRQIIHRDTVNVNYPCQMHRDGSHSALKEGYPFPGFQLLAGVYLTDVSREGDGGLQVITGSHADAVRAYNNGSTHIERMQNILDLEAEEAKSDRMCLLKGKSGTLLLVHSLTAHRPGKLLNQGSTDSKVYIRLKNMNDRTAVSHQVLSTVISF